MWVHKKYRSYEPFSFEKLDVLTIKLKPDVNCLLCVTITYQLSESHCAMKLDQENNRWRHQATSSDFLDSLPFLTEELATLKRHQTLEEAWS